MSEQQPKEKVLNGFAKGVYRLNDVLENLSQQDLDLSRESGKWTIRQIVHHIVDVEDIWKICIKASLGNPGCTVDMRWYYVDNKCAEPLDYAHRPIRESLELFRAARYHVIELLNNLPGAWGQSLSTIWSNTPDGITCSVGDIISFLCDHLEQHIEQIRDTRKKYVI